jgi:hypothetical protein
MPIVYDIDAERGLLRASFSGAISPAELLAWYGDLRAHPDFRDDLKEIADFTLTENQGWTTDEMKAVVSQEVFGPGAYRAFVGPTDLVYGLSRMYASFAKTEGQGGTIEVFRTVEDAQAWIDSLPAEDPGPSASG